MPWSGGTFNRANGSTGWQDDQSAGIGIEAGRHDTQDNDFRNGINECINAAGQNAATGNLPMGGFKHTNVANAAANDQYAAYGQVLTLLSQYMPSGAMVQYGGSAAPTGWLLCDGAAINRTTYASLFAAIGTAYGVGDGSTTFNVPDLRQRFPLGKAAAGTGNTLGGTGGAIDHTHTSAAHTHTLGSTNVAFAKLWTDSASSAEIKRVTGVTGWTSTHILSPVVTVGTASTSRTNAIELGGTTDSTTPAATGTNNPPYVVVNYIIRT